MGGEDLIFAVLEEFNLAETLFGFGEGFVGAAEIAAFAGEDLVAGFGFDNHGGSPFEEFPYPQDRERKKKSQ